MMNHQKNIIYEIKILDNILNRKIISYAKEQDIPFVLSTLQLKVLHYLQQKADETIYQRDIEKIIESRRSTTSGILNTMEKNNLIKRINIKNDARIKQIILTEYGETIAKQLIIYKKKFDEKVKQNITEEELETFFKVTNKIKNNIMNVNQ